MRKYPPSNCAYEEMYTGYDMSQIVVKGELIGIGAADRSVVQV